ncbi:MAG: hypothetical protein ACT4SY_15415 [Hyphomicrobiales bacterium]
MTRRIAYAVHWLALAAFLVIPFLPWAYRPAAPFFEIVLQLDPGRIDYGAALSRALLVTWVLVFVLLQAPGIVERLLRDAWGSWRSIAGMTVTIGLMGLFIGLFLAAGVNPFFRSLMTADQLYPVIYREDHLMENLTSASLFLTAVFLAIAAMRQRSRSTAAAAILVLLAITAFFLAGEEISWGQRVFGWQSAGVFDRYNVQKETNFHNLLTPRTLLYGVAWTMAALTLLSVYAERVAAAFPGVGLAYLIPSAGIRLSIILTALTNGVIAHRELTEEVMAWLLLWYSLEMARPHTARSSTA